MGANQVIVLNGQASKATRLRSKKSTGFEPSPATPRQICCRRKSVLAAGPETKPSNANQRN
jgi:hypothetical protein